MNLQEYVKYLIGVIIVNLIAVNGRRVERGVFDLIFGRFRSCGGCLCGRANRNGARFLGGETTQSHEFPWLANIYVLSDRQVSGVLINDRYILTAGSQILGATASEIKVSLGEFDRCHVDISSANISVDTVKIYPEYISEKYAHDLALIRLSRPIKFEKRISPVCLPNPGSTYLGQVGTLMGWTEVKSNDEISSSSSSMISCLPRKLGLPILDTTECLKSGIAPSEYHDDSGCMGVVGVKSIICNNDVGTAVLYRSYIGVYDLIGILSDGNICDDNSTQSAVYTRVNPHLDWILQNTKDACYCTK